MRVVVAALQYFEDPDAEVFGGRDVFCELRQGVEILKVIVSQHFPFHKTVEIDEVADHAGLLIDRAADRDLEMIVVSVTVGVVAFAIGGLVLGGGHLIAVQPVRGGEKIAAGEMGDHKGFDCRFSIVDGKASCPKTLPRISAIENRKSSISFILLR